MMRRAGMVIVGALAAVSTVAALERATFLLTNGERISGDVVFHTEARTNIRADKNEFNLKVNSGVEMPIPFAQVVAIDFAGGTPSAAELAALPVNGHLLSLRSGETRQGTLVDLVNGDTVRFKNITDGQVTNVPISEVRRVFLRTDRVREVYNLPAGGAQTADAAPVAPIPATPSTAANRRGSNGNATTVTVRGAVPWTDTGVTVRRGQTVRFDVSGGPVFINRTLTSGPAGVGGTRAGTPLESAQNGAVIGKVGTGQPFLIGTNSGDIRMDGTGKLMIGINDDVFDDNSGSFQVVITR
ncbi:MAG: hypothetical protein ABI634_01665 [Acidobacteriota bacterium]